MLDLGGFAEITIITVAALILIGPKELPKVLHTLGRWSQKIQRFKNHLSQDLNHHFYEGKFEEYQKKANQEIMDRDSFHEEELLKELENDHSLLKNKENPLSNSLPSAEPHDKS